MTYQYDLIVIGSGPAGEKGAAQAGYFGKKVALIEKNHQVGGTSANSTIPSKTLRETALAISGFRQRGIYGVDLSYKGKLNAQTFMYREQQVHDDEQSQIITNLARHHVQRYTGTASFIDPHTIQITTETGEIKILTSEFFLIASGSRSFRPPNYPFDHPHVYDSETILNMEQIPQNMVVIGAGVVGTEYACTFAALGIEVSLINASNKFLTFVDEEMTRRLRQSMVSMGVQFLMPAQVAKIEVICRHELKVILTSGQELLTQAILVSVGRASNTEALALDKVGVKTKGRGLIEVNQDYQTSVPHIYAAGDVIGFPALSSTSMEQARVAVVHAFDLKYKRALANILPYGIWTIPEISMAGETEQTLQTKKIPYIVGRAYYNRNPRGVILNEQFGMLKLLFSATDQSLLGVHIIGQDACELVATGLSALTNHVTTDHFINLCFNFPTLSEMYKIATYDAMGNLQEGEILGQA